ncbi:anti-CBASS protein Acb1 family protein [Neisseria elongata]|jgi:portal protein|uniref:anti-CBASS protein Acb1 family protein n=1 Tax=Neisseria elongata TaxID=495 RepID=UPI000D3561CB|nr:anti-CBASS Acb1 family protein [Neisseria elongata]
MSKKKKHTDKAMRRALQRLPEKQPASYSLDFPALPDGVKPNGLAMDNSPLGNFGADCFFGTGFIGYPRLAELAQISEYRSVSETTANEMTRQWIEIKSVGEEDNSETIKQIEECYERLNVRGVFRKAIETDGLFGRGQILVQIKDHDGKLANPLLLTEKTITKGSLKALVNIEPMWTTPAPYNAIDPTLPDFYKPKAWYVMAQEIHASRLFTLISRPVPDMLKPAYNFGGVSMTQLMMPYVERWLRTVDSVSDLLHSFSLSGIKTDMSAILSGSDDGDTNIMLRAELYNRLRDNRGLMLLSKDEEEFFQFNTPLSGLDALLAQSQEQMAAPSHTPLVKLLGITPSGLNASTEGEIAVYYDHIRAMQENLLRDPLDKLLKLVQLHLFGKVNDNITFDFVPLQQMSETELSTIRKSDTDRDVAYIQAGVVSAEEVRGRLASEPDSGYNGIDVEDVPEMPDDGFSDGLNDGEGGEGGDPTDPKPEPAQDAEWDESKHPRAENGQFGVGSGLPEKQEDQAQAEMPEIKGNELGLWSSMKELRNKAKDYAKRFVGKKFVNRSTGNEIEVPMSGVKHTLAGAADSLIKTIPAIPKIIQSSRLVATKEDKHNDPNIIAVEIYQAKVRVESLDKEVVMTVKHCRDGRRYYDHGYLKE